MYTNLSVISVSSISEIEAEQWDSLAGSDYPFVQYEFLLALEKSGCVSAETGWLPRHVIFKEGNRIVAALPLYIKTHSWGEYVFDQQWANAYEQVGLEYYPKLLTAIPYTPCVGSRLLIDDEYFADDKDHQKGRNQGKRRDLSKLILGAIESECDMHGFSSWHCLFPDSEFRKSLNEIGLMERIDIQFHWGNKEYRSFDDFLATLSSKKRKKIKRERRRVSEDGISMKRIPGTEVTEAQWIEFYRFYAATYMKRGRRPYLSLECFQMWAQSLPQNMLMVMAFVEENDKQRPVAAALSFVGADTLYGRYWGCSEEYNSLHFETCYYQGIEHCIETGLKKFDSGAQGEHKISRGFEPVQTHSMHWIKDLRFRQAIGDFVKEESLYVDRYQEDVIRFSPFKQISELHEPPKN